MARLSVCRASGACVPCRTDARHLLAERKGGIRAGNNSADPRTSLTRVSCVDAMVAVTSERVPTAHGGGVGFAS